MRGGLTPDDVPLYVMCRLWVQNSIDADCGPRPGQPVRRDGLSPCQVLRMLRSCAPSACSSRTHLASCMMHYAIQSHPALWQDDTAARLPPPLPPSGEALKDPPKEVALLQDEETLFLDEDTLPAEVGSSGTHAMH